jgi:hypothetical protein
MGDRSKVTLESVDGSGVALGEGHDLHCASLAATDRC